MDWFDYYWLESEPGDGTRYFVYALVDPRLPSLARYIGVTTNPIRRYQSHLSSPTNSRVREWLRSLASDGVSPRMLTLADCYGPLAATRLEAVYIDEYQRCQGGLLNGVFDIAKTRKSHYDREARLLLREAMRKARRESNFGSLSAKRAAAKRKPRAAIRVTFDC